MGFGGSGGGGGSIAGASDAAISGPTNGQVLSYNGTTGKWQNTAGGGVDTSKLKAVCVYSGSAYPTRPSGYGSVEWIGPVDPGASAQANDTWVNTA